MIAVEIHSPEPPGVVLAALRARAGEWRESQIPPELRRAGISAIECAVQGMTCALHYERRWYGAGASGQLLRALATAEADAGGTRVRVEVECHLRHTALFALGNGLATCIGVVAFGPVALLYAAFPLSVIGIGHLWMRASTRSLSRREDREADYLVQRLEDVITGAGRSNPVPQVS